ncbi:MAG: hexitol phosphatase HxpB [bacterium]
MIKAVIFDMDGILIDSEPFWRESETAVFARIGVSVTEEMCKETMGMRVDEVVKYRHEKQKWEGKSLKAVEMEIMDEIESRINLKGEPMPGVDYILDFFRSRNIRLALASSSYVRVINTILQKLKLQQTFEIVHSGEYEQKGKPHPAIYLSVLRKLNLAAADAIAIEDSYNGLLSARAAGLRTVVIPAPNIRNESRFDSADIKLSSLLEFREEHVRFLDNTSKVEYTN